MMVAVIVAPTLVILIVQVVTFPLTLHTVTTVNEVRSYGPKYSLSLSSIFRMIYQLRRFIQSAREDTNLCFQLLHTLRMLC